MVENERLATVVSYAYARNSCDLGAGFLSFGLAVASLHPDVGFAVMLMLLAVYLPTIAAEERCLRGKFPTKFDA